MADSPEAALAVKRFADIADEDSKAKDPCSPAGRKSTSAPSGAQNITTTTSAPSGAPKSTISSSSEELLEVAVATYLRPFAP